jgi:hypothetical protein
MNAMTDEFPTPEHNHTGRGKTRWWFVVLVLAIGLEHFRQTCSV